MRRSQARGSWAPGRSLSGTTSSGEVSSVTSCSAPPPSLTQPSPEVMSQCLSCRTLLCSVVRVKLSCYEMENQCSLSVEDYLKAFLENEVKPLWPKGWMQARSAPAL